ncbi:unnamed protein product [Moneuplotes crassus]|uniref:DUSP domain-containing protein n=1 Tax=Euplotes crassus TaxID=5936 RepID=A0AAD1UA75_EUPCR|nr:unnamed protein product [Moneuplotes crassus]
MRTCYFDCFKSNTIPDFDENRSTEVREIDNASLFIPKDQFINDVDPESHYNHILEKETKLNIDYIIVNEKIWNFFHSRYGGTTVKMFYVSSISYSANLGTNLSEIKLIILPHKEKWDIENVSRPLSIFASARDTLDALLERIINNLNSDEYGYKLSKNKIRLWKLAEGQSIDEIVKEVSQQMTLSCQEDLLKENQDSFEDHEKAGISFPGECIENWGPIYMMDVGLFVPNTLMLEVASDKTGNFLFEYEKTKVLRCGKCEYCFLRKPLIIQCQCEEVQYCSECCLKKDVKFHIDKCKAQ